MNQKNNLIIGLIIAGVVVMSANVDADPRDFVRDYQTLELCYKRLPK